MTEQQGGESLGTLEVEVTATLGALEAQLARAEQMLNDFDTKWSKRAREMGNAVGRGARGGGRGGGPASATADIKAESGSLKGLVIEGVKLKVDASFLVNQVNAALKGVKLEIAGLNVGSISSTGGVSTEGASPASVQAEMKRVFSQDLKKTVQSMQGLPESIDNLYTAINASLEAAGHRTAGSLGPKDDPNLKMAQIIDRLGLSAGKLVEFVDETGKAGKVTGGQLGPKGALHGLIDPADIKVIGDLAKDVSMIGGRTGYLTKLFEEVGQARVTPEAPHPTPASQQREAQAVAGAVAGAIREETQRAKRTEEPMPASERSVAVPVSREELSRYFASVIGPTKGNLPQTSTIAIPASKAGPGDTVLEQLQATKTAAGRAQGIQGGLGPLTQVLQAVERGLLENIAEQVGPNNRGTGTFYQYDPEEAQGANIRATGRGMLGSERVRRVNPQEMLRNILTTMFPGIEARSNPTDPMSSLLERVMVGPGAQSIRAGKSLAVPSRGTASESPSQTSKTPAGGLFTTGSARSLLNWLREQGGMSPEQARLVAQASAERGGENRERIRVGALRNEVLQAADDKILMEKYGGFGRYGGLVAAGREAGGGEISHAEAAAMINQRDQELYDELGLTGKARKPKSLPFYLRSERAQEFREVYGTPVPSAAYRQHDTRDPRGTFEGMDEPTDSGRGVGFRPRRVAGARPLPYNTPSGVQAMDVEYERPATDIDVKIQQLRGQVARNAEINQSFAAASARAQSIAASQAAAAAADRFGGVKRQGEGGEASGLAAYRFSTQAGEKSAQRSFAARMRGLGPLQGPVPDSGETAAAEVQRLKAIQSAADAFIANKVELEARNRGGIHGPLLSEVQESRAVSQITDHDALSREIDQILQARLPAAARRPGVRNTRDPFTGDELRSKIAETGGVPGGPAGGGGGFGVDEGGRRFVPGGAPIEVIVVGKFPLPVTIEGMGEGAGGGGGGGGKPRKNIERQSVGGKWQINWVPEGEAAPASAKLPPPQNQMENAAIKAAADAKKRQDAAARALFGAGYRPAETNEERQKSYEKIFGGKEFAPPPGNQGGRIQFGGTPTSAGIPIAENVKVVVSPQQRELERSQREQAAAQRRQAAELRAATRRANVNDPFGFARQVDIENDQTKQIRAALRAQNRSIPRRGFGASITDVVTEAVSSKLGNPLERQLEFADLAAGEAAEIKQAQSRRARARTVSEGITGQIAQLQAGPRSAEVQQRIRGLGAQNREQLKAIKDNTDIINLSSERFTKFNNEVTKGSTVMKSFAAAAAGSVVSTAIGSVTFGLGLAVTGPIIGAIADGFTQVAGAGIERLSGFAGTGAAQQLGLGQAVRGAGGRAGIGVAQAEIQSGLGPGQAALIGPQLESRASIEAGNQAFRDQLDQFRASQAFARQNRGLLGDAALSQNRTGVLGSNIGGTPSFEESLSQLFEGIPQNFTGQRSPEQNAQVADLQAQISDARARQARGEIVGGVGQLQKKIDDLDGSFSDSKKALDFFNARVKDSGANLKAIPGGQLGPEQRAAQAKALAEAGLFRLSGQVQQGQIGFQGAPTAQDFIDQLTKTITSTAKPSVEALLNANADQIKASIQGRQARTELNVGTLIPAGIGLEGAQTGPMAPAAAGLGLRRSELKAANGELAETQKLVDQVNKEIQDGQKAAIDFVQHELPGALGGNQFEESLGKVAAYGKQIAGIQLGVQTEQAAYAAAQYSYQIGIAKRSLQDARALVGQIKGDTQNLGAIERQQFMLQRESQALSLAQSQKQINFQVALANFQSPGLNSEEREARKQQAKLEAEYAQKQLDIQKQLFGLGGKQFQITASRNLQDLVGQIGLLEQGREVSLDTAKAEKKIAALTKLQAAENKRAEAYYSAAVENANDTIALQQELVAQTGKDLNQVASDVIAAYAKVYRGIISTITGAQIGDTHSETVGSQMKRPAITDSNSEGVRAPFQPAGAQAPIQIVVTGNTVRSDDDLDQIARKVEMKLQQHGALIGLRPFGG